MNDNDYYPQFRNGDFKKMKSTKLAKGIEDEHDYALCFC